jgi:hypothetical protein
MQGHVDGQESIPYIESFAGPGYFNDLDMMIVGNMSQDFCALAAAAACIICCLLLLAAACCCLLPATACCCLLLLLHTAAAATRDSALIPWHGAAWCGVCVRRQRSKRLIAR